MMAIEETVIQDLKTHLERVWGPAHKQMQVNEDYYRRTFAIWRDAADAVDRPNFHLALPTAIIDHAVANQLGDEPKVHCEPAGKGENHKSRANLKENFLAAVWDRLSTYSMLHPGRQNNKHTCLYGYTQDDLRLAPLAEPEPKRREGEERADFEMRQEEHERRMQMWLPWKLDVPPPNTILLPPMERIPKRGIKVSKMYAYELEELTRLKAKQRGGVREYDRGKKKPFDEIEVWEYFDWSERVVFEGKGVLWGERNIAGTMPFKHAYSGWGHPAVGARVYDPADMAKGLLDPVRETIRMMTQNANGKLAAVVRAAFARPGVDTNLVSEEQVQQDMTKGNMLRGPELAWWLEKVPDLPQYIFQTDQDLMRDVEVATYALILAGYKPTGVDTATQHMMLSEMAHRIFASPKRQLEFLVSQMMSDMLRHIEVLDEVYGISSVTCNGVTITPEDVDGMYDVQCTFELLDPVVQMQKLQMAAQLRAQGIYSTEEVYRVARIEDTTKMEEEKIREAVRAHPAVADKLAMEVAKTDGLDQAIIEYEERMKQQAAQQGPGRGPTNGRQPQGAVQ